MHILKVWLPYANWCHSNLLARRSSTLLDSEINHDFSHAEIVEITNNFGKVLGTGGSGKVYYGQLKNGNEVAVKVLKDSLVQGTKEFVSEVCFFTTTRFRFIASVWVEPLLIIYNRFRQSYWWRFTTDAWSPLLGTARKMESSFFSMSTWVVGI